MRQAAVEWPDVRQDAAARNRYFDKWNLAVRQAFQRPSIAAPPDTVVGPKQCRVTAFDQSIGVGFILADDGGATYFFRWDEIKIDAHYKSIHEGARVAFEARISHAGERSARDVVPKR